MLDKQKHEQVLISILRDIYTNNELETRLALKGGTCLYLFYGLDRFSVDLDFNVVTEKFDHDLVTNIVSKYLNLVDFKNKHFTWYWLGSYEKGKQRVKIEISKRSYPDRYVNKDYYGLLIPTMSPECMFAHKLCAVTDRKMFQARDIYDINFMFNKQWSIEQDIVKLRTGKTVADYCQYLIAYITKKFSSYNILDGLGELLSDSQKMHTKDTLLKQVVFNLNVRANMDN